MLLPALTTPCWVLLLPHLTCAPLAVTWSSGRPLPSAYWMAVASFLSRGPTSEVTRPVAPARAVRPALQ